MGITNIDIPLLEQLVLSRDRRTTVKEIFPPGSEERAFFEVLHALLQKDFDAARSLLDAADTPLSGRERERLEAFLHLQAWDDSADPASHTALQQLLLKKLQEAGYNLEAYPNYVPTAPTDPDDFEQVGDAVFPSAVTAEQYSLQELVKKLQEAGVSSSLPAPAAHLLFPHVPLEVQVQILQAVPVVLAGLPDLEGVIKKWMDQAVDGAGSWLQSKADGLTAEQLQNLLMTAPRAQRDPRLQRLIQSALVKKLYPSVTWEDIQYDFDARAFLLSKVEQLCQQMGQSADWIRVQVLASQLELFHSEGRPLPVPLFVQFLETARKIAWMSPPAITIAPNGQEVHEGVSCDRCGMAPITGVRYKSQSRHDYDVCANCFPLAADAGPYTVISGSTYHTHIFQDFTFPLGPAIAMPQTAADLLSTVGSWLRQAVLTDNTGMFSQPRTPLSDVVSPEVYNKTVAEALLISGRAQPEEYWVRLYEAAHGVMRWLVEQQQLEFLPSNKQVYVVEEAVNVQLCVKNISSVLVKVYEINSWNYYTSERKHVDPSLQLVGISPTMEKTFTFNNPPLRREVFNWQLLEGRRGTFIVDVIGAGLTRRALIRKGHLRYTENMGVSGHELKVFYEDWSVVQGARAWLGGRTYEANENGDIVIPYARLSTPGQALILGDREGAASLYSDFNHRSEDTYDWKVAMYLERECVQPHEDIPLVISTNLFLHSPDEPVPLELVENVALQVEMQLHGGTTSTQVIKGFRLSSLPQVVPIHVHQPCCEIRVKLTGRIRLVAPGDNREARYHDLCVQKRFSVDTSNTSTQHIWDVHLLGLPDGNWGLQVLGRAGEVPREPIRMQVTLVPWYGVDEARYHVHFQVQTNATGQVKLGALDHIIKVKVDPPGTLGPGAFEPFSYNPTPDDTDSAPITAISVSRDWFICPIPSPASGLSPCCSWNLPVPVGGVTGSLTVSRSFSHPSADQVVLWSVRTDGYRSHCIISDITQQHVQVQGKLVRVSGLPAGQYKLTDLYSCKSYLFNVLETQVPAEHPAWLLGVIPMKQRVIPYNPPEMPTITCCTASTTEGVSVRVEGSSGGVMQAIIVFKRFMPFPEELQNLHITTSHHSHRAQDWQTMQFPDLVSTYMQGTPIPPALQYVLRRRELSSLPRPGNMLDRPSLLSAPHKVGTTTTINQDLPTDMTPSTFEPRARTRARSTGGPAPNMCYMMPCSAYGAPGAAPPAFLALKGHSQAAGSIPVGVVHMDFCPPAVVMGPFPVAADGWIQLNVQQLREKGVDLSGSGHTVALVAVLSEDKQDMDIAVSPIKGALGAVAAPLRDLGIGQSGEAALQCVPVWDVSPLQPGTRLEIPDMTSTKLAVYDNLTKARDLLLAMLIMKADPSQHTLLGDAASDVLSNQFSFLMDWPRLTAKEKLSHLKERWCNEVNFFLYHRDQEFFNSAILPAIQSKLQSERCFLDWWFLGDPDIVSVWNAPNKYSKLNAIERILLAERMGRAHLQQLVHDWEQQLAPGKDPSAIARQQERRKRMVQTALAVVMQSEDSPASASRDVSQDEEEQEDMAFCLVDEAEPVAQAGFGALNPFADLPSAKKAAATRAMGLRSEQIEQQQVLFKEKVVIDVWAEVSYYKVTPAQEANGSLVTGLVSVNEFWLDFARWMVSGQQGPFLTTNLGYASNTFTAAVMGLAVIGLPFEGQIKKPYHTTVQASSTILKADGPIIAFHQQQKPAPNNHQRSQVVLVSQVLIDPLDPSQEDPVTKESFQKVVSSPLRVGHVYCYSVVVTNMSPSHQSLDLVIQVPQGAIQLDSPEAQTSIKCQLGPFCGVQQSNSFYFPHPGTFNQYPCSVLRHEQLIWTPENPLPALSVLASLPSPPAMAATPDEFKWSKFVATASNADMLQYLSEGNLGEAHLPDIAGRCHDKQFFMKATEHLRRRHVFCTQIWQFAVKHMDKQGLQELLPHLGNSASTLLGDLIVDTELIKVKPRDRDYRHLEFWPVVHRLAHPMPSKDGRPSHQSVCQLLDDNSAIKDQWRRFLYLTACKPRLGPLDVLEYAQYLILQDRLETAEQLLASFFTPEATEELGSACALQVDYMRAWLNISSLSSDLSTAQAVAVKYKALEANLHPMWAEKFRELNDMLEEVQAAAAGQAYNRRPDSKLSELQEPVLLLKGSINDDGFLNVTIRNISQIQIHAYVIDVELIFTAQPFDQIDITSGAKRSTSHGAAPGGKLGQVSFVKPTCSWTVPVVDPAVTVTSSQGDGPAPASERAFPLQIGPLLVQAGLGSSSVMVELCAGGLTRSTMRFASNIHVELREKQGTLQALDATTHLPLAAAYVKVFAQAVNAGKTWLFKDGYTDRRGRFNYATITAGVDDEPPARYALLVVSSTHGAVILEAIAPV